MNKLKIKHEVTVDFGEIAVEKKANRFRIVLSDEGAPIYETDWFVMTDGDNLVLRGIEGKVKFELATMTL